MVLWLLLLRQRVVLPPGSAASIAGPTIDGLATVQQQAALQVLQCLPRVNMIFAAVVSLSLWFPSPLTAAPFILPAACLPGPSAANLTLQPQGEK